MKNIKKPNWDEPKQPGEPDGAGFYNQEKGMPPVGYISKGMAASANINKIRVDLKIISVLENNTAEAEIIKICSASETIEGLHFGDIVFIENQYIGFLDQTDWE